MYLVFGNEYSRQPYWGHCNLEHWGNIYGNPILLSNILTTVDRSDMAYESNITRISAEVNVCEYQTEQEIDKIKTFYYKAQHKHDIVKTCLEDKKIRRLRQEKSTIQILAEMRHNMENKKGQEMTKSIAARLILIYLHKDREKSNGNANKSWSCSKPTRDYLIIRMLRNESDYVVYWRNLF